MEGQSGDVETALFFLRRQMKVGGQRHSPASLPPKKRPGTHFTGGWVGPMAAMDSYRKSCPTRIRSLYRPAHSNSILKWYIRICTRISMYAFYLLAFFVGV